jgi:hypothetical protein
MRNSRDSGSFAPRSEAFSTRTPAPVSGMRVTPRPIRTPGTPLRGLAPSAAELVARDIATILLVPAVMLIVVWVVGRVVL